MTRPAPHPPVTLAVLAGGEGARMGRPKGTLQIRGRPILGYLLDRFAWPGPTLLVTAPGREHPPGWELFDREVADPVAGLGPLRGLITALEAAVTPLVLVTTVDMPGIEPAQLEWLIQQLDEREEAAGVMCCRPGDAGEEDVIIEPFPCAFRTSAAGDLRHRLEAGQRSIHGLAAAGIADLVPAPARWLPRLWVNLNRPEDLRRFEESP